MVIASKRAIGHYFIIIHSKDIVKKLAKNDHFWKNQKKPKISIIERYLRIGIFDFHQNLYEYTSTYKN